MDKQSKRNIGIEKETKQAGKQVSPTDTVSENLKSKKYDPETGQTQYPKNVGFHGTQNEQELNPEE